MEFLKNIEWTPLNILKALGLFLAAIIVLSIAQRFISPITGIIQKNTGGFSVSTPGSIPGAYNGGNYGGDDSYDYAEEAAYGESRMVRLSTNNIGIPSPQPNGSVGGNAEEFEVTEYSASIETRNSDDTCTEISKLKEFDYVVFENANEYEKGCSYSFKVEHDKAEEILAVVKSFNPKNVSESTYTIKRQLDDFTSETEILENKLASIDETLKNAVSAYDEITILATRTQNVESLAKIISNKISLIERLTQERISTTAELERLSRSKAEQLDRLEYTYFFINVYENKFVDGESIKESWKAAVKEFVRDVNRTAQDITINLVLLLFILVQYILYFFIVLIVVKYLWKTSKYIWRK